MKIFLFAAGGLAGVLLLAALAVLLFFDINAYKPRVEAAISNALKMDVTIDGQLGLGFIPGLHLTLESVRIRNRGTELAFVKEADLSIALLPLFQQQIHYGNIATQGARILIERDRDGRYNYERPPAATAAAHPLDLPRVSFVELIVVYADKQSGGGYEFTDCTGELTDLRHPGSAPFLKRLSLAGQFACGGVRGKIKAAADLKFSVEATDGVFDFKPVTMRAFGGNGSGTMRMDRAADVPTLHVSYALSKFRIEEFFKPPSSGKSVAGVMDFSTTLSMRGRTRVELRQSASGVMTLSGINLTIAGVDLDKELSKYASSQNFNLFDMTAFLFAGPIGLAVTKGYDFSSLAQQSGGSTQIRTVVSKWKVDKGVAHARDVAMATAENRLALQGGLNFVDDQYDDVVVALIDSNGCAKVRQKIHGPFGKPVVEKPNVLTALAGPVLNLLNKAREILPGAASKCEVFYSGSMAPPK